MADEKTEVLEVSSSFTVAGAKFDVYSFSIGLGMNIIPYANVVIPLTTQGTGKRGTSDLKTENTKSTSSVDGKIFVFKGSDFSETAESSLNTLSKAMDKQKNSTLNIDVFKFVGDGRRQKICNLSLKDWKVSNFKLMPQSRDTAGGIQVSLEHPMCKLRAMPGFFVADTPGFHEQMKDVDGENVIEIGDAVIKAILAAMETQEYRDKYKIVEWQNGAHKAAMSQAKLSDYIKAGKTGLPFVGLLAGVKGIKKACVKELATYFTEMRGTTPYDVVVNIGNMLGYSVCPKLNDKAELRVTDPWGEGRSKAEKLSSNTVYQTTVTPDTDKLCGARVLGTRQSNIICSTLAGTSALSPEKTSVGDTLYFYQATGRMVEAALPAFVTRMLGRAATASSNPVESGEASTTSGKSKLVSDDELYDPSKVIKAAGTTGEEAKQKADDLKLAWASAQFLRNFRATMHLIVTQPLVNDDIPEIGSFIKCDTGTGGGSVTGLVMSTVIEGSSSGGRVTVTTNAAYAGEKPDVKLENLVWKQGDGKKSGKSRK